ncbi:MAG: 6-phosphogluconolactonase [Pseudomonadota bacterium]
MIRVFSDPEALSRAAAEEVCDVLQSAVSARGKASLVLSGGVTPRRTHELLSTGPGRKRVSWDAVEFFFGDERPVGPDHPDSNFRMANETLLEPLGVAKARVHRMRGEREDKDLAAREYEEEIAKWFDLKVGEGSPVFDLILLGLGPDGHTASLFPGTRALDERTRWVVANPVPLLRATRLTMTVPVFNAAERVLFLVAGSNKAETLQAVLEGPSDPAKYPAQKIGRKGGTCLWLADRAAASLLTPPTEAFGLEGSK